MKLWLLLLFSASFCFAQTDIQYAIIGDASQYIQGVEAYMNSQQHIVVTPMEGQCLHIADQRDFDNNGKTDALIQNVTACDGNGAANSFFFVFYDGQSFRRTKNFGYSWGEPVVEVWNESFAVYTVSDNSGFNLEDEQRLEERHILQNGQAVLLWSGESQELPALAELRVRAFEEDFYAPQYLFYDLNSDGQQDIMECNFWEQWGVMNCTVDLHTDFYGQVNSCKRVGVLETQTNGMHDLVCGDDTVLTWQNGTYQ